MYIVKSSYTPYGLKTIESNFIARIQNINSKIKSIHNITRVKRGYDFTTEYVQCNKDSMSMSHGVQIEWENGYIREFKNGDTSVLPKIDISGHDNKSKLIEDIIGSKYMSTKTKVNLLENLENISRKSLGNRI